MTLDVFLEGGAFDREAAETALARDGIASDSIVGTADGGEANISVDDDGCVFVIRSLTPEVAQIVFDVALRASLAILPADGTPNAFVVGEAAVPEGLEPRRVETATELYAAMRESVTRREEMHGARST